MKMDSRCTPPAGRGAGRIRGVRVWKSLLILFQDAAASLKEEESREEEPR